ncbi:DUF2460 domain-containing protein [Novosphingobium sp. TH158]|uniref:DUF2460 domain-containing protein n=1 Tax=Novosphingobium sp. TH158 TaxID=2067455 RepID=UPI000C7E35CF|nr:DUF2460 domain-containing protein [Novosphingobium sp. TH158]PLK27416.1 TIGR02217 family protein [Novosphingobium sp. TH158]
MAFWLATAREGQETDWIQRFDPRFWTIDFPRPMMASVVASAPDALRVDAVFMTEGDLAGLIWSSEDLLDHPLLAYRTDRDYTGATLSFRWRSSGVVALDAVNGPTLTVEGRDAAGTARTWYVRLWNYAQGTGSDAQVSLPFRELAAGWAAYGEAVHPAAIDRLFISLVAPGYVAGSSTPLPAPAEAWVELTGIACTGARCILEIGDVVVPPHGLACATAYDDACNQTPQRLLRNLIGLGYRGSVLHYLGMSHFFRLSAQAGAFLVDPAAPAFCTPAVRWHRAYFAACTEAGLSPIASLSYELLAQHCPDAWQQRAHDGAPARTGWDPPSALLSPASSAAMAWLQKVGAAAATMLREAGAAVRFQIGEPWWWVDGQRRICLYDDAAKAALGGNPPVIADLAAPLTAPQKALLDQAGALLAASTAALRDAVRAAAAPQAAEVLLLSFLPTVLDPATPEALRANLPTGWASPAFDRLQLEDYDWLTAGKSALRRAAYALANDRLGYPPAEQDYLAGFVPAGREPDLWLAIDEGIDEAQARSAHEVFVWALPQVCRDGFVRLPTPQEDSPMQAFDDIAYPLALGRDATVIPEFSTSVSVTASGFERRNSLWSNARLRFDVGPGIRSELELGELIAFFRARRGAARGFRLRDPTDFSSSGMTGTPTPADQLLGIGDDVTASYPLVKRYGEGAEAQLRRITRPLAESVLVQVGSSVLATGWTLDPLGVVTFQTPPASGVEVRAGFLFDVPVRFAEDSLQVSGSSFAAGEAPSVPVVEVREAS